MCGVRKEEVFELLIGKKQWNIQTRNVQFIHIQDDKFYFAAFFQGHGNEV